MLLPVICWFIRDSPKVKDLNGKHILITGCDSRFGHSLAQQLARKGFCVIAACLTEKGSQELITHKSLSLRTVILDLTDSRSINNVVAFVKAETEGQGKFGLVNNAGRATPVAPTDWMQIEDSHTILDVNLMGLIEIILKLLSLLKKAKGRVINIASVMGHMAFLGGGYCLSKWGVEAFSDILWRDMQHFGVEVSIIEPGFFKTGVTSLEVIEKDLLKLWNRLSSEVREYYGDKYFVKYIRAQRLSMKRLCDSDFSKVITCIEHALIAEYPSYTAGLDAKLFWLSLSYAPTLVSDTGFTLLHLVRKQPTEFQLTFNIKDTRTKTRVVHSSIQQHPPDNSAIMYQSKDDMQVI
ncbi:PREDICTED: retinol dehydrogenase 7-like [Gavialis gangeticus]|uniref:retinol dehydrogenase 7-like n=1 Tax=Gavialis gangeticus TaxID=94835 RepID=UPI00092F0889|nr:PREDICTED: retinol dehydrogenase 7-like [Gavialis gangeticus]